MVQMHSTNYEIWCSSSSFILNPLPSFPTKKHSPNFSPHCFLKHAITELCSEHHVETWYYYFSCLKLKLNMFKSKYFTDPGPNHRQINYNFAPASQWVSWRNVFISVRVLVTIVLHKAQSISLPKSIMTSNFWITEFKGVIPFPWTQPQGLVDLQVFCYIHTVFHLLLCVGII